MKIQDLDFSKDEQLEILGIGSNLIERDKDWDHIFKMSNWKINIIYGFKVR